MPGPVNADGRAATPPLRAMVVDDHPLFVRALQQLLPQASGGGVEVVGWTTDARLAGSRARHLLPDLALVDLLMPEPGGLRAIAAVRRSTPACRVVAISGTDDLDLAHAALDSGADAFLHKSARTAQLVSSLAAVADGWSVLPAPLLHRMTGLSGDHELLRRVGGADRHLWRRLAEGRSTAQVAGELHVSERSVKRMTAALLRTLGVATRMEAAALAGRIGLLDGPSEPATPPPTTRPDGIAPGPSTTRPEEEP